jgi:hypothetical protein
MKIIKLTQGFETMVDDEDFEELIKYKWYSLVSDGRCYAIRNSPKEFGKQKHILMHKEIAKTPKGMYTDHIDGNTLNNIKSNLRIVTNRQNGQNRHENKTSRYVGVYWNTKSKKWESKIRIDGKRRILGFYKSEIEAHNAYLNALKEINEVFVDEIQSIKP